MAMASPRWTFTRAQRRGLIAAALVVVVSIAAFVASGRASSVPEVRLGGSLTVGQFDYRVDAVRMADVIDFGAAKRKAEGRFAIVELSVVNRTDERRDLPSDVFRLVDDGGRSYMADAATNRLQNGTAWGVVTAPGVQRELLLAFDVAPDSVPQWLEVRSPDGDPRRLDADQPYAAAGRIRLD
jgi:hypothetical protein